MSEIYYLANYKDKIDNAAYKAPSDIAAICSKRGYKRFNIEPFPLNRNGLYQKYWLFTYCTGWWKKLYQLMKPNDILIYQHPLSGVRIAIDWINKIKKDKKCKAVAVIHDLPTLRGQLAGNKGASASTDKKGDVDLLRLFDAVICHNEAMQKVLTGYGIDEKKLINLHIFDYLSDEIKSKKPELECSVSVAGNLDYRKSGYIYKIKDAGNNAGLKVHLYGSNIREGFTEDNMTWHGSYDPSELPSVLEGSFGLVWDGNSVDTCSGNTGEYLRYNNPHKVSLYLAAGMPVIIWRGAAMADFVLRKKAGLTVDSLYEIETVINSLTESEYDEMRENAADLSELLRKGQFFSDALDKALAHI